MSTDAIGALEYLGLHHGVSRKDFNSFHDPIHCRIWQEITTQNEDLIREEGGRLFLTDAGQSLLTNIQINS